MRLLPHKLRSLPQRRIMRVGSRSLRSLLLVMRSTDELRSDEWSSKVRS